MSILDLFAYADISTYILEELFDVHEVAICAQVCACFRLYAARTYPYKHIIALYTLHPITHTITTLPKYRKRRGETKRDIEQLPYVNTYTRISTGINIVKNHISLNYSWIRFLFRGKLGQDIFKQIGKFGNTRFLKYYVKHMEPYKEIPYLYHTTVKTAIYFNQEYFISKCLCKYLVNWRDNSLTINKCGVDTILNETFQGNFIYFEIACKYGNLAVAKQLYANNTIYDTYYMSILYHGVKMAIKFNHKHILEWLFMEKIIYLVDNHEWHAKYSIYFPVNILIELTRCSINEDIGVFLWQQYHDAKELISIWAVYPYLILYIWKYIKRAYPNVIALSIIQKVFLLCNGRMRLKMKQRFAYAINEMQISIGDQK